MTASDRLLNVQALRAVAVLLVMLFHVAGFASLAKPDANPLSFALSFGFAGVDLFFVISGFIMIHVSRPVMGRPEERAPFMRRRLERIYPVYWVVWLGVAAGSAALGFKPCNQTDRPLDLMLSFLLLPQAEPNCFVPQAWTLNYEVYFYLLFALVVFLPRAWAVGLSIAWALYSLAATYLVPALAPPVLATFNAINLFFLTGCLIAFAPRRLLSACWPLLLVAGIAGFGLSAVAVARGAVSFLDMGERFPTFGLSSALIVIAAVGLESAGRYRPPAWLVRIGDASYSLYVVHMAVMVALHKASAAAAPAFLRSFAWEVALFTVSLAAGLIFHAVIERPLLGRLRTWRPRRSLALAG